MFADKLDPIPDRDVERRGHGGVHHIFHCDPKLADGPLGISTRASRISASEE